MHKVIELTLTPGNTIQIDATYTPKGVPHMEDQNHEKATVELYNFLSTLNIGSLRLVIT